MDRTMPATLDTAHTSGAPSVRRAIVRWFFPAVSALLCAGVLAGFSKTFFLRSQFHLSPMPAYLYVHGSVLTTWFVLVFAQTWLVASRRTALHRQLGVAAMIVAGLIIPISAYVIVHAAQREGGTITPLLRLEVVGDLLSLVWFAGFVAAAFHYRRRADLHKRLMIAACFTIYGPVFARFNLVFGLPLDPPVVIPLALVALGTYDFVAAGRLHRGTVWIAVLLGGGLSIVLGGLIASGAADVIIRALR